jgi:hypothetical protein
MAAYLLNINALAPDACCKMQQASLSKTLAHKGLSATKIT